MNDETRALLFAVLISGMIFAVREWSKPERFVIVGGIRVDAKESLGGTEFEYR